MEDAGATGLAALIAPLPPSPALDARTGAEVWNAPAMARLRAGVRSRASGAYRALRITPELVWFLTSPKARANPYPAYARLRRLAPVHRSPIGVYVLSGHAQVSAALHDPTLSSDERRVDLATLHVGPLERVLGRGIEDGAPGPYFERVGKLLLFQDPPDHTRLRALVNRAFTPRRVRDLEPRIEAIAHDTIDSFIAEGSVELMNQFAYPFPAQVICELIGVPPDESHHIIDNAPPLAGGLDPGPLLTRAARDAANTACVAIVEYLDDLIDRRAHDPGDDLLSALLDRRDGDALSHDELVDTVLLLLIAGHETTANLIGNGIVSLLDQPAALAELRSDPTLDRSAVDELLRFDSPVQMTMRVATSGTCVDGRRAASGSVVILVTGAANRDESVFSDPDRLDWRRRDNPHVAFGGGVHYCLGAALARAEARIALRAILDRLPGLRPGGAPVRRPSFTIRALSELPLTWDRELASCGRPAP